MSENTKKKSSSKKEEKKAKNEELEMKIRQLEETVAKDKDDYLRLMAEFDNYRRRTSQEKLEIVSMASTETIKGLLPVLDAKEHLKFFSSLMTATRQKKVQS